MSVDIKGKWLFWRCDCLRLCEVLAFTLMEGVMILN
jgi:hypothetical protein